MGGTSYAVYGSQGGGGSGGGVTSLNAETGDVVLTSVDSSVVITPSGQTIDLSVASASGDVAGPASATDMAIARFNGTTGKLIQNSTAVLDGSGNVGFAGVLVAGQVIDSGLTVNTVPYTNASKQFTSSAVTPTELGFVSGVTSAIQTQLNAKQATGNYLTGLTGDVTASGPGSVASTLATVNASVGSFTNASLTVNAKGLVTAASSGAAPVTSISVATANGLGGSSSGGATPALTLSTSVTGIVKGNGTALSAATAGTDYSAGTSALATGILKSTTTTGALTIAVAADFPTLNQNTSGTASNVTASSNSTLTTISALSLPASQITGVLPAANVGLNRTLNNQTGTSYAFVLGDGSAAGGNALVTLSNASAQTVTIPTNASVAFPVGTEIDCLQLGAGKVTFAAAGGVTLNSASGNKSIAAQYVGVSLLQVSANSWVLFGNLIA